MGSKNKDHQSLRVITEKGIYSSKILDLCSLWKVENGYFAHLMHCDFSQKICHSSRKIRGCIACSEVGMREFVLFFYVLLFSPLFGCQTLLKKSFVGHYGKRKAP